MDASIFTAKLEAWRRSQEQPWNRLRYALVVENVLRHTGTAPVRILDVGGGDGRDAVPLAQAGHQVTLVDYVPEMLEEALRRASEAGVNDRIRIQAANLSQSDSFQVDTTFDVLLLHNVLQYLPDPNEALGKLAELIRPKGILSILVPNPHSEALRQALQRVDIQAALTSLDRSSHVNQLFGAEIMSWRIEELNAMLAAAGIQPFAHYGVRCVTDYIQDNRIKYEPEGYAQLLELERAMGTRSPYRDMARLWQFLARRQG